MDMEKVNYKKINLKYAAMFGLDARIALAIFGALSVISGAALYSAIQTSKATALLVELQEVNKAYEAFYLDTGQHLSPSNASSSNDNFYVLNSYELIENTGNNWHGPYLPFPRYGGSSNTYLDHSNYDRIMLFRLANDDGWDDWAGGKCTSGKVCNIWVRINIVDDVNGLAAKLDELVDDGDGYSSGSFRYEPNHGVLGGSYHLKGMPIKNPHD